MPRRWDRGSAFSRLGNESAQEVNMLLAMRRTAEQEIEYFEDVSAWRSGIVHAMNQDGTLTIQLMGSLKYMRNVPQLIGADAAIGRRVLLARVGIQDWVVIGAIRQDQNDRNMSVGGSFLQSIPLGCRVTRSTNQGIATGDWVPIDWDTEISDTDGCWSDGTNSTKLYARHEGYYAAGGSCQWDDSVSTAGDHRGLLIRQDGSLQLNSNIRGPSTKTVDWDQAIETGMFWMDADNYIEICVYHDRGSNHNINSANAHPCGWLVRLP